MGKCYCCYNSELSCKSGLDTHDTDRSTCYQFLDEVQESSFEVIDDDAVTEALLSASEILDQVAWEDGIILEIEREMENEAEGEMNQELSLPCSKKLISSIQVMKTNHKWKSKLKFQTS